MTDAVDAVLDLWLRERPDLDPWPTGLVGRVQRLARFLEQAQKEFLAGHGLEYWEFDVLTTLRRSGPPYELSAGALIRATMVTSGAITNRLDRMEVSGLVERVRDTADRRSVRARLTARGHDVVDTVFPLHIENGKRMLQDLAPEDREPMARLLRTLLESFGDTSLD
ncbi:MULTISPECIES: MarR family winged helix-turn-helix transcriptional regulator [Thermomonosporaceae]|uniref:MarR family winged helix-turn-helix transcriptional regulator n=1 Tax=Thermomonosporaceae TaxID=2012 RepID=UPI00255ABB6E|nr:MULTISPECIES: MarR family transcriptional regulator [Thermomonosporaceae]MDL4777171.1 MarR family transcriptional regulator [Actinomadura xylanilytica]